MIDPTGGSTQAPAQSRTGGTAYPVRDIALRYAIAIAAVALAFAARSALAPVLGDQAPYLFFVPAVLLAAGAGGFGPGILATALSLPLVFFFIASLKTRTLGNPNGLAPSCQRSASFS